MAIRKITSSETVTRNVDFRVYNASPRQLCRFNLCRFNLPRLLDTLAPKKTLQGIAA